jgi:hypothetical protein
VEIQYESRSRGSANVVIKIDVSDEDSRKTGAENGLYESEVQFYKNIAPKLDTEAPIAKFYHSSFDETSKTFYLVLGDVGLSATGNGLVGATMEEATLAVKALASLQVPFKGVSISDNKWLERGTAYDQAPLGRLWDKFFLR